MLNSRESETLHLSEELIFVALASDNGFGKKPQSWPEAGEILNSESVLPNYRIKVFGPPPTSGTYDAFIELILEEGARKLSERLGWGWDEETIKQKSHLIREDGAYAMAGENDSIIVRKLEQDPEAVGILGFYTLDQNLNKLQGVFINGVEPTFENIESKDYPASRDLFFYVKKYLINETTPLPIGLMGYLSEFISQKAIGEYGYLVEEYSLIPLSEEEFEDQFKKLESLPILTEEDL